MANERDELGNDLVPDYLTSVKDGGFYGWPYSYFGQHVDERVQPPRPDLVAKAISPDYALGAHVAALGPGRMPTSTALPRTLRQRHVHRRARLVESQAARRLQGGVRAVRNGKPSGMPVDVLTGFVSEKGEAWGRPVGVEIDKRGALLVADDVGNVIWRAASEQRNAKN